MPCHARVGGAVMVEFGWQVWALVAGVPLAAGCAAGWLVWVWQR